MNVNQIVVDVPKTVGTKMWLHGVRENRIYKDGKATGETDGYRYEVFCIDKKMLPLSVKIPGKQLIAEPEGYVPVEFSELELKPYIMDNQVNFTATAKHITLVKE